MGESIVEAARGKTNVEHLSLFPSGSVEWRMAGFVLRLECYCKRTEFGMTNNYIQGISRVLDERSVARSDWSTPMTIKKKNPRMFLP